MGKIKNSFENYKKTHQNYFTKVFEHLLNVLKAFCKSFPTCEGCPFREDHIGCQFKEKTPREW